MAIQLSFFRSAFSVLLVRLFSIYTAVKPTANILRDNACAIAVSKIGGAKMVAQVHWLKCLLISRSTYLTLHLYFNIPLDYVPLPHFDVH